MAIDMGASGLVPRTPAWKKLGLQLKSARDRPNGEELHHVRPASSGTGQKRKRSSGAEVESHDSPVKVGTLKRSSGAEVESQGSRVEAGTLKKMRRLALSQSPVTVSHPPTVPTSNGVLKPNRGRGKAKSVSFTADTKSQDGDSARRLFDAWLEEEQADDPSFRPEKVSEALTVKDASPAKFPSKTIDGHITKPKPKKKKKEKKKKATPTQKGPEPADPSCHPALTYLLQYSQERSKWKFNKAKQSYILKHLLNLDRIPSEHERALCSYVTGLQVAAVRARVRRSMECVKAEELFGDSEDSSADEAMKRARQDFEKALAAFVDGLRKRGADVLDDSSYSELYPTDEDLGQKVKRRKRAEAILWALSQSEDYGVDFALGNPATLHPNARANGTRTELVVGQHGPHHGRPDSINGSPAGHQRIKLNVNKPQPRVKIRMRKLRTNAVDFESSSSSSSSSSESGSGTDDSRSDDGSSGSSSEAPDSRSEGLSTAESMTSVSDSDSSAGSGSTSSSGSGSDSDSDPDLESTSTTDSDSIDSSSSTSSGDGSTSSKSSSAVGASDAISGEDGSDDDSSRSEGAFSNASSSSQTSSNSSGYHKTTGHTKRKW